MVSSFLQPCLSLQYSAGSHRTDFLSSPGRRIRSRTYHEETSFALIDTSSNWIPSSKVSSSVFDVREEVAESLASVSNILRIQEEEATPRNVTAQMGHSVFLHCIVEPIGDKMVSWLRLRDFHLLTVGLFTYTSDERFVVRHGTLQPNDWALQIKHVLPADEGIYECQVNSDPPRSQYYRLKVVIPETGMIGSPDMFVRGGSPLNLTCLISNSPELPSVVFWYHNDRVVNYDFESNGRGLITLSKNGNAADSLVSSLLIRSTKLTDSGNYSCHFVGSSSNPAHIYVHVLQGERRQSKGEELVSGNGGGGHIIGLHPFIQNDETLHAMTFGKVAFSGVSPSRRRCLGWQVVSFSMPILLLLVTYFLTYGIPSPGPI